jgi:RNA polymerase sigma-70 factor (ECF subfamily)
MSAVINNERFRILLRSQPVEALGLIHQLYSKSLFLIAYRLTRDQDEARDIVQDTFHLVWKNRKQLSRHHEKSIEHYLVRVVRNKAVSYFKRRRHLRIDDLQFLKGGLSNTQYVSEFESLQQELILEMRNQINTFPMREQQCLLMKIDREMSLDQIAAELKISRKMVEKSQTNALKRLKKWGNEYKSKF